MPHTPEPSPKPKLAPEPIVGTPLKPTLSQALSQTLKLKSDIHLTRKAWHCLGICAMAAIYNFGGIQVSWMALLALAILIVPLDFLRQTRPGLNSFVIKIFGPVMRRHESHHISGMTYLIFGTAFLLMLNQHHIVTLTLLFLAFGDPVASFFGLRFGTDKILGNKTLQGTLAAFAFCAMISGVYYYFNNIMIERLLIVVPLSGLIGAVSELMPIGKLDDNLTFPVVSSLLLWLLFTVYGGFGL